jgi:hypothetical protein
MDYSITLLTSTRSSYDGVFVFTNFSIQLSSLF